MHNMQKLCGVGFYIDVVEGLLYRKLEVVFREYRWVLMRCLTYAWWYDIVL